MKRLASFAISASLLLAQAGSGPALSVTEVRHWSLSDATRISVRVSGDFEFRTARLHGPERVYFDILNSHPLFGSRPVYAEMLDDPRVSRIHVAQYSPDVTRVVLTLTDGTEVSTSRLANPDRLMVELRPGLAPPARTETALPPRSTPSSAPAAGAAAAPVLASDAPPTPFETPLPARPASRPNSPSPVRSASAEPPTPLENPLPAQAPSRSKTANAAKTAAAPPPTPLENPLPAQSSRRVPSSPAPAPTAAASPHTDLAGSSSRATPAPSNGGTTAPADSAQTGQFPAASAVAPASPKASAPKLDASADSALKTAAIESPKFPAISPAADAAAAGPPPGAAQPAAEEVAKAAKRTSAGGTSLVRALGLKISRVVIDPGHGGHDQGTSGPHGLLEKDVVLDVAQRVGQLIEQRMGAEVIYTRSDDTFIPLQERTAIANEKKADLFLSIHANSSPVPPVAGIETFYLSLNGTKYATDVATRENASFEKSVFDLPDLIQQIAKNDKAQESREFADRVQAALFAFSARNVPGSKNRGVKSAPFVVLIGAHMPSILTEIGFLTNPKEESLLKKPAYRQQLAEAIYKGVSRYADSLSHFQPATATAAAAKPAPKLAAGQ
ncbi:MAG TPA: N-acetylmuramoyl-L-alanine amidase [Bryobacteraceae bacterium]|nr:N-acetylmuramoyl-L-alanine amidase [Bryobacteraceae bacterium]